MPDGSAKWDYIAAAQSFVLEIDYGLSGKDWSWLGSFHEVSGLSVAAEPTTIAEGGQNQFVHKRPGRMTWPNVTLKRGLVENDMLFAWFSATSGHEYDKAAPDAEPGQAVSWFPVQISLVMKNGEPLRSWVLDRAFPVKWSGPTLAVTSQDVASEEVEIAHHGFKPTTY